MADKDNSTVIMHVEEYRKIVNDLFNETLTYRKRGNPTNFIHGKHNKIVKKLH